MDISDYANMRFIVDTGAMSSLIKIGQIRKGTKVQRDNTEFYGIIKNHSIKAMGKVKTFIIFNGTIGLEHTFYIVQDEINLPNDGIIGSDFLKAYNSKVNYLHNNIKFQFRIDTKLYEIVEKTNQNGKKSSDEITVAGTTTTPKRPPRKDKKKVRFDDSLNLEILFNGPGQDPDELETSDKSSDALEKPDSKSDEFKNIDVKSVNVFEGPGSEPVDFEQTGLELNNFIGKRGKRPDVLETELKSINSIGQPDSKSDDFVDTDVKSAKLTERPGSEPDDLTEPGSDPDELTEASNSLEEIFTTDSESDEFEQTDVKPVNTQTSKRDRKKIVNRDFYDQLSPKYFEKFDRIVLDPIEHEIEINKRINEDYNEYLTILRQEEQKTDILRKTSFLELNDRACQLGDTINLRSENHIFLEEEIPLIGQQNSKYGTKHDHNATNESIQSYEINPTQNRLDYLETNINLNHCTFEEKKMLKSTFLAHSLAFQIPGDRFQHTDVSIHKIGLKPGTVPVNLRQFRIPECHKAEIQKQLNDLESKGIISRCDSPWNAPIFLVPKKPNDKGEKQYRLVIDYRELG